MTDTIPANLLVQTAACDERLQKLQIRAFAPGGHDLTGEVILAVREVVAMVETLEKSRTLESPAAPQVAGGVPADLAVIVRQLRSASYADEAIRVAVMAVLDALDSAREAERGAKTELAAAMKRMMLAEARLAATPAAPCANADDGELTHEAALAAFHADTDTAAAWPDYLRAFTAGRVSLASTKAERPQPLKFPRNAGGLLQIHFIEELQQHGAGHLGAGIISEVLLALESLTAQESPTP